MAGGELSGTEYLRGNPCPKCGHVRTAADTNPDWQCPKCQIAYLKYRPAAAQLGARLVAGGREMAGEAKADRSIYALIAAKLLALLIAYLEGMTVGELLVVYWLQSVVIGITNFIRILSLGRFDPGTSEDGKRPLKETKIRRLTAALHFVLVYGGFHAFYLFFLQRHSGAPLAGFALCTLVFAVNHGYSLMQNLRRDAAGRPDLGTMTFLPFLRIIPMHLSIVIGGLLFGFGAFTGNTPAFSLFATLKIAADALMHSAERHVLGKGSVLPPPG